MRKPENTRAISVNPRPYKFIHKAGPLELLVDYDSNGDVNKIYVTDENCNPIDLTGQILYKISHANASDSSVFIDGFGTINLQEYLNIVNTNMNSTVKMVDVDSNCRFIPKSNKIDKQSINTSGKNVQIAGFDKAQEGMTPVKRGNTINWEFSQGGTTVTGSSSGNSNKENPVDGLIYGCVSQNIVAHRIYLQASLRQKTIYPDKDFTVVLPETQDSFCQIWWFCKTNDFVPDITFSSNVFWKTINEACLYKNTNHLFKFMTFDNGITWLAEPNVYKFTSDQVSQNKGKEYFSLVVDDFDDPTVPIDEELYEEGIYNIMARNRKSGEYEQVVANQDGEYQDVVKEVKKED